MPRLRTLSALSATACLTAATALTATAAPSPTPGVVGNKPSFSPDLSGNGRYVVFASDATNLVPGDTNGKRDIFVRDTVNKTTRLVSKGLGGKLSNGASYSPSISDDGRYVAYTSQATNLVTGDTNSKVDAFRTDLTTGTTIRVSVGAANAQGNGVSEGARISGNGALIVFGSTSSNLVKGDTNNVADVFLRDTTTGTTRRLSLDPSGDQLTRASGKASISVNGAIIGFAGPSGAADAIYRWDKNLGRTTVVAESGGNSYFGTPLATNGGVSYTGVSSYSSYDADYLYVQASPASESFTLFRRDGGDFTGYDLSKWGAMAVFASDEYDTNGDYVFKLHVVDDGAFVPSESPDSDALATLTTTSSAVALSGDGSRVAFATADTGQITLWTWKTGALAPVSTSNG